MPRGKLVDIVLLVFVVVFGGRVLVARMPSAYMWLTTRWDRPQAFVGCT